MTTSTSLVTGVDFVSIPATNMQESMEFYENVLGLEPGIRWQRGQEQPMGAEYETGTVTLALMDCARFGIEFAATCVPIALQVEDVPAARSELESRGVEFVTEIIDSGVCHQAFFTDPAGNAIGIHHRYKPR